MRDVIFNGKFRSQPRTGVQRVAEELVRAVGEKGVSWGADPTLMTPPNARDDALPGVQIRRGGRLTGIQWEQLELPRLAGGDLLVNLCNVAPLARTGDILMIHDAQAFLSPESYSRGFALYYRTLVPRLARRAAQILTVSEFSRDALSDAGVAPRERIKVVPNGVDHMLRIEAQPDILARSDLSSRRFILAPASVQRHKNIGVLLEAAEFLESSDVLLVLYGSAGAAEFKAAGLTLGPNVRLVGRVSDGEMKSLMQAATAFAFPSTTEGFGLPPLEAMLMGAPAIVAPRGPLPALCGDAVLYADPGEGAAWAEAITTLLEDEPKRLALSEAGRRRAAGYRWADAADLLQETILEVLGADGRRAVTA